MFFCIYQEKEKEFNCIEAGQLVSEISGQVANINQSHAEINAMKAANAAVAANLEEQFNDTQRVEQIKKSLQAAGEKSDDESIKNAISLQIYNSAYSASYEVQMKEIEQFPYGTFGGHGCVTGGDYRQCSRCYNGGGRGTSGHEPALPG